jgi:hypothetical protein
MTEILSARNPEAANSGEIYLDGSRRSNVCRDNLVWRDCSTGTSYPMLSVRLLKDDLVWHFLCRPKKGHFWVRNIMFPWKEEEMLPRNSTQKWGLKTICGRENV